MLIEQTKSDFNTPEKLKDIDYKNMTFDEVIQLKSSIKPKQAEWIRGKKNLTLLINSLMMTLVDSMNKTTNKNKPKLDIKDIVFIDNLPLKKIDEIRKDITKRLTPYSKGERTNDEALNFFYFFSNGDVYERELDLIKNAIISAFIIKVLYDNEVIEKESFKLVFNNGSYSEIITKNFLNEKMDDLPFKVE